MTQERVKAFADASAVEQLIALAQLRRSASSDEAGINIGLFGLLAAVLVAFLPPVRQLTATSPVFQLVSSVSVGVFIVLAFLPLIVPVIMASTKRSMAVALLGAYEDELARRHRDRAWANRRWRSEH